MTEDDVTAMAAAVLDTGTTLDPAAERTWAQDVQTEMRTREQRLMAEWKMWRQVRQDAKMQAVAAELATVRGCVQHVGRVLAPAQGPLAESVKLAQMREST